MRPLGIPVADRLPRPMTRRAQSRYTHCMLAYPIEMDARRRWPLLAFATLLACGPQVELETDDTSSGGDSTTSGPPARTTTTNPDPSTTTTTTTPGDDTTDGPLDVGGTETAPDCDPATTNCGPLIDLMIVIDNSGTMGAPQQILARSFPLLVERLEGLTNAGGMPVEPDVNVMVTTTDFGNPLCTPFEPAGYDPARGAPIGTACTSRLQDFTNLTGTLSLPEVCESTCPAPVQPDGPFLHFSGDDDNVPDSVMPADIDGDGVLESPAAQALACIGPQGINGCGFESPLENMLQALNPAADWNQGAQPFMRPDAMLAIVLVSDEADCSIMDYSIMNDPTFMNINPDTGTPQPSSAICWNAGVSCTGPDAMGVFSECHVEGGNGLQPIARYTDYILQELRGNQGKEVVMLGIVGVPPVYEHSADSPYQPTAGGAFDLVYRNWVDPLYPAGDILPDEWADGVTAADKQFDFGIGPGCTGTNDLGQFTAQAIPPVRMLSVCQALDLGEAPEDIHCCIESVCDSDYRPAIDCLAGMIAQSIPAG
jgi:hypothetical protein